MARALTSRIAMDEPFTAVAGAWASPAGAPTSIKRWCRWTLADTVRASYPASRRFDEPHPYFVDEIMTFVRALEENEQVGLAFFRLDYDVRHKFNADTNSRNDLLRLRDFLAGRKMEFEVIVTGYDGRTDAASVASAMALAYEVSGVIGRPTRSCSGPRRTASGWAPRR
jgi:hypothetical protein